MASSCVNSGNQLCTDLSMRIRARNPLYYTPQSIFSLKNSLRSSFLGPGFPVLFGESRMNMNVFKVLISVG